MFACSGLLYNHESPRRGFEFVTRKISVGVARIAAGLEHELKLGSLDAQRDWGHARDYVQAMWLMLQQAAPVDFVVGTGEAHSVREFADIAFQVANLDWRDHVVSDSALLRPEAGPLLVANPRKARQALDWSHKTDFLGLIREMVCHDIKMIQRNHGVAVA